MVQGEEALSLVDRCRHGRKLAPASGGVIARSVT